MRSDDDEIGTELFGEPKNFVGNVPSKNDSFNILTERAAKLSRHCKRRGRLLREKVGSIRWRLRKALG